MKKRQHVQTTQEVGWRGTDQTTGWKFFVFKDQGTFVCRQKEMEPEAKTEENRDER